MENKSRPKRTGTP